MGEKDKRICKSISLQHSIIMVIRYASRSYRIHRSNIAILASGSKCLWQSHMNKMFLIPLHCNYGNMDIITVC